MNANRLVPVMPCSCVLCCAMVAGFATTNAERGMLKDCEGCAGKSSHGAVNPERVICLTEARSQSRDACRYSHGGTGLATRGAIACLPWARLCRDAAQYKVGLR